MYPSIKEAARTLRVPCGALMSTLQITQKLGYTVEYV